MKISQKPDLLGKKYLFFLIGVDQCSYSMFWKHKTLFQSSFILEESIWVLFCTQKRTILVLVISFAIVSYNNLGRNSRFHALVLSDGIWKVERSVFEELAQRSGMAVAILLFRPEDFHLPKSTVTANRSMTGHLARMATVLAAPKPRRSDKHCQYIDWMSETGKTHYLTQALPHVISTAHFIPRLSRPPHTHTHRPAKFCYRGRKHPLQTIRRPNWQRAQSRPSIEASMTNEEGVS